VEEELVETVGRVSGILDDSMVVSPDGNRLAFVERSSLSKRRRVLVDGEHVGGVYDEIAKGTPLFSWDSKRLAFVARRGNECFVVIDDKVSEPYATEDESGRQWPVASMVFSPDSAHVAYQVHGNDGIRVVVDGNAHGPYDDVTLPDGRKVWGIWEFMFSPDSRHFAYRARNGEKMLACAGAFYQDHHWNKPVLTAGPYDAVGRSTPVWVPGRGGRGAIPNRFAFVVREGESEKCISLPPYGNPIAFDAVVRDTVVALGGGQVAYVARKENKSLIASTFGNKGGPYDGLSIPFTKNGRLAYAAAVGKEVFAVVDGKEGPRYEGVRYPGTVFGPQGKRVAYAVRRAGKAGVWIDEQESRWYHMVDHESFAFSPDGTRFAFAAKQSDKEALVVLDGADGPLFSEVSHLRFNSDGSRFAYAARQDLQHWLVVDEKRLGPYDRVLGRTLTFSPDGKHYACVVFKEGSCRILSDGVLGPVCDAVVSQLVFSPGSDHLAYVARVLNKGRRDYAVVYDRAMGQFFDTIWMPGGGNLAMDNEGVVRFFAVRSGLIQVWTAQPAK
jgi:hypothetical protein